MKRKFAVGGFLLIGLLIFISSRSQQIITISGTVKDSATNEPLQNATVRIKGTGIAKMTDNHGGFSISSTRPLPLVLLFSHVGFEEKELEISSGNPNTVLLVKADSELGIVKVYGPTRKHKNIQDAIVTVIKYDHGDIANSAAGDYYREMNTKKGIGTTTSGLLFNSPSTRGFNGSGSTRVNQIVDGMDNQAPGLNFFVGNFAGLTELDVENVELLPGASSALYGPGGMNGTILINSKNPFQYPGLNVQVKQGIMHVDKRQRGSASPFYDYSLRWAKAFREKFAFKIGVQYISAKDWLAGDSSNYQRMGNVGKVIPGNRMTDPNYDGVNVYGDETSVDIYPFLAGILGIGHPLVEHIQVSRTGYAEKDVIDPATKNIKLSGALHYKLTKDLEAELMGYWGTGNTVYTGNNRYVFKGIKIGQYKLELKHKDWFIRSYTTQEDAGEAYSATVSTQIFNEAWKRSYDSTNVSGSWYPQFTGAYLQARGSGADKTTALNMARSFADQGRPAAGSQQFKQIFDQVRSIPIPKGGLFLEKSQLWMTEGQYDFSGKIKFAEIIAGANLKKYILDSKGTLFIDTAGAIGINETGAYVQATRKMLNEFLTLSLSGRYDKNEDFKGHFTPRIAALIKLPKNNNFRISYQTAYRFPSTLQKYIRLDVGDYTLLGGLPWVMEYMNVKTNPVFELNNSVPAADPYVYKELKPETCRSFEIGYNGLIKNKLLFDAYVYSGGYQDFLGRNVLYQPGSDNVFSTVVNSSTKVKTHGIGLGADYRHLKWSLFANVYSDVITGVPSGFQAYFNTPKYKLNAGIANTGLGKKKRAGFNVVMCWQDALMWEGELANGPLKAFATMDAQVNYKLPKTKSMIKLGGTNIFNRYYKNAFANPEVGGLYYASFAYNIL
jgi:outer membrane receptor protein involved in Fe transport